MPATHTMPLQVSACLAKSMPALLRMESAKKFLWCVKIGNIRSTIPVKMYQVSVRDITSQVEFALLVLMTTNFKMMEHVSLS